MPEFPLVPDGPETGTTHAAPRERPLTRREIREQQRLEREAAEAAAYGYGTPSLDASRPAAADEAPVIRATGRGWSLGGDPEPVEPVAPEPVAQEPVARELVAPEPAAEQPLRRRRDARPPAADAQLPGEARHQPATASGPAQERAIDSPSPASPDDAAGRFATPTTADPTSAAGGGRRARRAAAEEPAPAPRDDPFDAAPRRERRAAVSRWSDQPDVDAPAAAWTGEPAAPQPSESRDRRSRQASLDADPAQAATPAAVFPTRSTEATASEAAESSAEASDAPAASGAAAAGASLFGDLVFDPAPVAEERPSRTSGPTGLWSRLRGRAGSAADERGTRGARRRGTSERADDPVGLEAFGTDTFGTEAFESEASDAAPGDDDFTAQWFGLDDDASTRSDAGAVRDSEAPIRRAAVDAPAFDAPPVPDPAFDALRLDEPAGESSAIAADEVATSDNDALDPLGSVFAFESPDDPEPADRRNEATRSGASDAPVASVLGFDFGADVPPVVLPTPPVRSSRDADRSAAAGRTSAARGTRGRPATGTHPTGKAPRDVRRAARRRAAAARGLSVVAMGFVAMITVATSLPADSLLSAEEVAAAQVAIQHEAGLEPQVVQVHGEGSETDFTVETENYQVATIAEYAAASGIRVENTFTNNPFGTIQWPFPVGVHIGSFYGYRSCAGCTSNHHGIDFNPGYGAEIQAIADGTVSVAQNGGGSLGVVMMIDHVIDGQVVTSVYAHMKYDSMRYQVGDTVQVGDIIGNVGSTGLSTGPHLHFEIRIGGVEGYWVDPLQWLYENTD